MKKYHTNCALALLIAWLMMGVSVVASAQEAAEAQNDAQGQNEVKWADEQSWSYRGVPERFPTMSIARQKAQARGNQRMARLEAMRWYGFSNSRPTATAMPWTAMYSPAWQMPGGRPYAWYVSARPVMIYVHSAPLYR